MKIVLNNCFLQKYLFKKILKYNYEILLIDTIYKTNKYKISLIIINKIMLLNVSYYITLAFIFKKTYKVYK